MPCDKRQTSNQKNEKKKNIGRIEFECQGARVHWQDSPGTLHLNTWAAHQAAAPLLHESSSLPLGLGEHVQTAEAEDTARFLLDLSSCAGRGAHTD